MIFTRRFGALRAFNPNPSVAEWDRELEEHADSRFIEQNPAHNENEESVA